VVLEGIFGAYRLVNYALRELKSSPYQVKVRTHPVLPFSRFVHKLGIKLNVTAIMTLDQVRDVAACLDSAVPSYISVFAGRVADTGRDPVRHMAEAVGLLKQTPQTELIWACPRELLNIFQADSIGCHIITVTNDVLKN
jgi:transaldolase